MQADDIRNTIKDKDTEFIRVVTVDINGIPRSVLCHFKYFITKVLDNGHPLPITTVGGFQINGDLVDGTGLTDAVDYQNGIMLPDFNSFRVLPWLDATATIFSSFDFPPDRAYNSVCCRSACQKQLAKLKEMGYGLYSAFEYEFYVADSDTMEPISNKQNMYSVATQNKTRHIANDILRNLYSINITPEVYQAEYGPSQLEISITPNSGILGADDAMEYKSLVRDIGSKHGRTVLFLSKCYAWHPSSSGHFNHSLWDLSMTTNKFRDENQTDYLSDICKNWLAGLQEHSKALIALTCHTLPCYDRCQPGGFAPTTNAWGMDNRTVAFRVKNGSHDATFVENRMPGAGSNPYLVTIGTLIAGMDGIKRNLQLKSKPYKGFIRRDKVLPEGVEELPASLEEALKYLREDELFVKELGEEFLRAFEALKRDEIEKISKLFVAKEKYKWYQNFYGPCL